MLNPFFILEKLLYRVRDFFWDYPDKLLGDNPFKYGFIKFYKTSSPYSHFVSAVIILGLLTFMFTDSRYKTIVNAQQSKLIEAVVMGVDDSGRVQKINKVNPLIPTNIQLEKDLIDLIYEPLIKYDYAKQPDGTWVPTIREILASEVIKLKEGADYQFNLRRGVRWHDGKEFTANDVIATFDLVSKLEKNQNAYIRAIKQLRWEKIDDYTIRLCTKGSIEGATCNQIQNEVNPEILSNFLELVSIKIIPAHKISDINETTLENFNAELFISPVGTGKYKFYSADTGSITLIRNDDYIYSSADIKPQITSIQFKFYKTLTDSVQAVENGEAHGFASISVQSKKDLEKYTNVSINLSPVINNQYWGIYFNLKKDPDGKPKGPAFFTDSGNPLKQNDAVILNNGVRVRQAISSAINRAEIIQNALLGVGAEAFGPIPAKSEFFNGNAGWFKYNVEKARALLDEAGWHMAPGQKYRANDQGEEMKFSLYFVNSYDRFNVARVIKKNLEDIGINVIIDRKEQPGQDTSEGAPIGWTLDEINRLVLAPRSFDAILYGMNTFIDPDRFELFHSSQVTDPGLNIGSYIGTNLTPIINPNRKTPKDPSLINVSKVDLFLEQAKRYDPERDKTLRKSRYNEIQIEIARDSPVVFLYHPQFIYYTNTNLKQVDILNASSVEDRFRNIEKWRVN